MNRVALNIDEIFFSALEIEDPNARSAYLNEICGGDAELRDSLDGLLAVNPLVSKFLESPAIAPAASIDPPREEVVGTLIGPYRLLEQIGEGGMGVVYVAEQTEPVRRRVALKVIKPGMDTRQVIARFEAERQALAIMDHSNIARVFDGGATRTGRPYFVMELVQGIPITDHCDREQLAIPERLELFVLVCRAVQHAHQKGIIHRDLKPSNILVTVIDGVAVPKVIDFGVARASGGPLTDRTLDTGFAQLVGTPLYMSPEQAGLAGVDVDTRSDVYALGVLLYELLTGTTPIERETLCKAAYDEIRRVIREQEPPTPSTRLGTLGVTLPDVSARRKADPRHLGRSMRGELDWVVMKALEKDRERRYETAGDFAADVLRHLTDRPVEACPPSAKYRLSKYARRNRMTLTTSALVGFSLVAGTAASLWQATDARDARLRAEGERDRAIRAESQAMAIGDFLQNDLLLQVARARQETDGVLETNPNLTVREALDRAAARIGGRFHEEPLLEAVICLTIGRAYRGVAQDDLSVPHFQRSVQLRAEHLGPYHPDTIESLRFLATAYRFVGRFPDALAFFEWVLEHRRATLGPDDPQTIDALYEVGETHERAGRPIEGERLMRAALDRSGRRDAGLANAFTVRRMKLARRLLANQNYAEAEPVLREVVEIRTWSMSGKNAWARFYAMSLLGDALMGQGKIVAARVPLLDGYLGMKQRESTMHSYNQQLLYEAEERISQYHETAERTDAVRLWRERKPPAEPDPLLR